MDGWVVLGELYVKPVDWEELYVIAPDGVGYRLDRHWIGVGVDVIGTAPTPRAAARLVPVRSEAAGT